MEPVIDASALMGAPPPVAVLVDFDNVAHSCLAAGFSCSFTRLREYVRTFGRVPFAEVYLSPYSSYRQETVRMLHEAGWVTIMCPLASKDKDSVDAYIKARALSYAQDTNLQSIIIVSEDGDLTQDPHLNNTVQDLGKRFITVKPTVLKNEIAGEDRVTVLHEGAMHTEFSRYLDMIVAGTPAVNTAMNIRIGFMRDVMHLLFKLLCSDRRYSFRDLQRVVWNGVSRVWHEHYNSKHVQSLLTVLNNRGYLSPIPFGSAVCYVIPEAHHAFFKGCVESEYTGGVADVMDNESPVVADTSEEISETTAASVPSDTESMSLLPTTPTSPTT